MLSSLSTEDLLPADHPIRRIRKVVDDVLGELDSTFDSMYSAGGRPSVPPEMLLKSTVLMAMYSMRDEFFAAVVRQAKLRRYMSSDHFSVDGTLLEAWASHKSLKPKDDQDDGDGPKGRNIEVNFKGQKRSNDTHASTTDPDTRLYRKSNNTAAQLCYSGHLLIEHRSALIVDADLTFTTGYAERDCAAEVLKRLPKSRRRRTRTGVHHQPDNTLRTRISVPC